MRQPVGIGLFWILFAGGAAAWAAAAPRFPAVWPGTRPVSLENTTIIDLRAGRAIDHRDIVVQGGRIVAVGPAGRTRLPRNAIHVTGRGRFVIPGLWDMHVHLTGATQAALPVLVAHGVTGVRDMGGDMLRIDRWRSAVANDSMVGPRIVRPGPYLDGPKNAADHFSVATPAVAAHVVDSLVLAGVDFIKVHNAVPRDVYFAIVRRARAHNIQVCGHVPATVSPEEASAAGQASIEHFATLFEGTFMLRYGNQADAFGGMAAYASGPVDTLARTMVRNHTWFTPTLVTYAKRADRGPLAAAPDPGMRWVAAFLVGQWDRDSPVSAKDFNPGVIESRRAFVEIGGTIVARMQAAGVEQLAGSDLGARDVIPGASLHEELERLVGAGMTPLQALTAATLGPAKFLGFEAELGTIETGKAADLVVLDANPLEDISSVRRIQGVMLAGRYFDRAALDALLAGAQKMAASK